MSLKLLKQELETDPLGIGYSNMTVEEILISLKTPNRPNSGYRVISSAELLAWSGGNRRKKKLREAILNGANEDIQNLAEVAVDLLSRDSTELDLNLADRVAMLDALVSGGVLDNSDKTSLLSLATKPNITRLQELGMEDVFEGDIIWVKTH